MPRKAFMAHLAAARQSSIPGISNIARGAEDGEIEFTYTPDSGSEAIMISVMATDVSEYPGPGNMYFASTSSHAAPEAVSSALERQGESSSGMTIQELLFQLTSKFSQAYAGTSNDPIELDSDGDTRMGEDAANDGDSNEEDSEDESVDYYPDDDDDDDVFNPDASHLNPKDAAKLNRRIRQDLQAAKQEGIRVGILDGLKADSRSGLLSLSTRISKLGLSDEALQAWDLKKEQYLVLLIQYGKGYKTFDFIVENGVSKESNGVEFRVGLCNRYKPTTAAALAAFRKAKREESGSKDEGPSLPGVVCSDAPGFSSMFISSSLNDFMNEKFVSMMKFRRKLGVSWDGAKMAFNMQQGTGGAHVSTDLPDDCFGHDVPRDKVLPEVAQSDHISTNGDDLSFPLIAMQFVLRYFIRCPEFCLICHDKTTETFEALKPYVCSRGLCLFQYMQLGFGPSIEHEILTQPYVVDLLISFCYTAAKGHKLRSFPLGQSILVPPNDNDPVLSRMGLISALPGGAIPFSSNDGSGNIVQVSKDLPDQVCTFLEVKFDVTRHEVIFENSETVRGAINMHEWVVIQALPSCEPVHYRVVNTSTFPIVQLSEVGISRTSSPTINHGSKPAQMAMTPPPSAPVDARLSKYELRFDLLDDVGKSQSILMLLETLPKITEMRDYLSMQGSVKEPRLAQWSDRITSHALTLLRWIISSNRSVICQVDNLPGETDEQAKSCGIRLDQRVSGMDNWIQFRFAQGAPDKEQRFVDSLSKRAEKLNPKYPTIFAWHGSALHNWHSIIRTGLDYKETINGRAFGNGCYFSQDLNTSTGYSNLGVCSQAWPGSQLQITTALAMAEILNAPDEYQSKSPHLVVQHVDWIQCRYLFVNKGSNNTYDPNYRPGISSISQPPLSSGCIEQDPKFEIKNSSGQVIGIPAHVIASRKAAATTTPGPSTVPDLVGAAPPKKKAKKIKNLFQNVPGKEKDLPELPGYHTDETDADDAAFFFIVDETADVSQPLHGKRKANDVSPEPQTDFVPGSLDPSSLEIMASPSYATSSGSKQLSLALKSCLKTQSDTPLHELGWSIDERFIDNLYQWIVELHSFDAELPLAKDMKKAGITSVVLEIRFGKNFPISPPFVRIIRPGFLPFGQGGGGHVTLGGALCMELLTNDGWSPVNTIESVLMQIRLAISSTDPKPARLEKHQTDYRVGEAMEAFVRACNTHGWQVPADFQLMRTTGSGSLY